MGPDHGLLSAAQEQTASLVLKDLERAGRCEREGGGGRQKLMEAEK